MTLGNICLFLAIAFLRGPWEQLKVETIFECIVTDINWIIVCASWLKYAHEDMNLISSEICCKPNLTYMETPSTLLKESN